MRFLFTLFAAILVLAPGATSRAADAPATLPAAGPRVVCFGDSITKQGYPAVLGKRLNLDVVNAGVGGHNTKQGLARMEKDVLAHKPDVVVVLFGTNDCRMAEPSALVPLEQYERNLTTIVERSRKAGAKVVLCTLPPIDPTPYFTRHKKEPFDAAGGLAKVVADYAATARKVAKATDCPLVDLNASLAKEDQKVWLSPDGVHPSEKGMAMIAERVAEVVKTVVGK
ncbi:MAG TPA: GDSL-type esterase/lipase family protein [Humisphaera sp.]